ARTSSAKSRMPESGCVNGVSRRNRLGGNRSTVPRTTPLVLCISTSPSTSTLNSSNGPSAVNTWAEGVLMGVEPRVRGDVDAPADDVLAFVVAGGEAQHLDHAHRRRVVAMD